MKEISDIQYEFAKKSTGCFKDRHCSIWYLLNGKPHRLDGPAIKHENGTEEWLLNGRCHRLDGPAVITQFGKKVWWYYGIRAESEKEFFNPNWRKRIEIQRFL